MNLIDIFSPLPPTSVAALQVLFKSLTGPSPVLTVMRDIQDE